MKAGWTKSTVDDDVGATRNHWQLQRVDEIAILCSPADDMFGVWLVRKSATKMEQR